MTQPMTPSTEIARALVSALVDVGVREIVVAPGSRNAPLSFAAYDAAQAGAVRLHTRLDERSAGFLALGLTKVGSRAAVICTSGTAVANLHPALLEAAHAGVPMVAVTADRPARLRGTDANQTTDQVGVFGPLLPTHDLADPGVVRDVLALSRPEMGPKRHGLPLHLNVQLDEPLVPGERWADAPSERAERPRGP
jgi:2-succinyl-5-enolpyruvyl-6-hydroxy-3-cyclohexene-1-carboxylate synthase